MMVSEDRVVLPCGGIGYWDYDSDSGYCCVYCFAVIGSAGMPSECKRLLDEEDKQYG